MKLINILIYFSLVIFITLSIPAVSQTTITTNDGIEIFQIEKFYLLKNNVEIISEEFKLSADLVKAYFNKDLYDITKIESSGNAQLSSLNGIKATGDKIIFSTLSNIITVEGLSSFLTNNTIEMYSDSFIKIDNSEGLFAIKGNNSKLVNADIIMTGKSIIGKFESIDGSNIVKNLEIKDDDTIIIKTKNIMMYGKLALYNETNNIIELFENVKIVRNNETVTGDYAKINLLKESYKVSSKNTSNKVKIILENNE